MKTRRKPTRGVKKGNLQCPSAWLPKSKTKYVYFEGKKYIKLSDLNKALRTVSNDKELFKWIRQMTRVCPYDECDGCDADANAVIDYVLTKVKELIGS